MSAESRGRGLFIVDNSVSGWTGLPYLEEWAGIASAFDVATGFFEIGALLALDGKWQGLKKIRVLMGAETTHRTRKALLDSVRARAPEALDRSIESEKQDNPFLHGVPAVLEALSSGQIECRVYDKAKRAMAEIVPFRPRIVETEPADRYVTCVPLIPFQAAAGAFGDPQTIDETDDFEWAAIDTRHHLRPGMFVAQVVGKSMEPAIPDGAWRHTRITLKPNNPAFEPIVLTGEDEGELRVVAELIEVLGENHG